MTQDGTRAIDPLTVVQQPSPSQDFSAHTREKRDDPAERGLIEAKRRRQGAFLAAYEETGRVLVAAQAAGIDKRTYFNWMKEAEFEADFRAADQIAIQHLEDHAVKLARGLDGATTSERLLIKLLESKKPEVYNRPTRMEHSGPGGSPIETNVSARDALSSRILSLTTTTDPPSGS